MESNGTTRLIIQITYFINLTLPFTIIANSNSIDYTNYQKWSESFFHELNFVHSHHPLDDPDNDGYSNKYEYAFAMNPLMQDSKWYTNLKVSNGFLEIDYPLASQANTSINLMLKGAESLNGAFNSSSVITGTTSSGNQNTPAQLKSILLNTTDKGFIKIDTLKVRYKSPKRGIGISNQWTEKWASLLDSLNPSWHYSWNHSVLEEHPEGLEFVPQFWGKNSVTLENVRMLKPFILSGKVKYIIGFNEPELESQANMSLEEAIQKWIELETFLKSEDLFDKVELVSPAVAFNYENWLIPFLDQALELGLKIDYIALHGYTENYEVNAYLNRLNNRFATLERYGKQIWLKEFSVRSIGNETNTPDNVLTFMQAVLPELENYDWIFRYAWFSAFESTTYFDRQEDSILFNSTTLELTPLGDYYRSIENWF